MSIDRNGSFIRTGNVTLNGKYPKQYRICALCAYLFHSSRSITQLTSRWNTNKPLGLIVLQKRSSSQTQGQGGEGEENRDGFERTSSSHREFHRRAYERKRSSYQQDKQTKSSLGPDSHLFSQAITHYQRLNVDPEAKLSDIKSAYYSLSKLYHPDVTGPEDTQAAENFRLITESYDLLSDAKSRSVYDKQLNLDRPTEVAWTPSNKNNGRDNPVFRMRDADLIFRMRQEASFLEEKRKNPEKFRAGSFTKNGDQQNVGDQLLKVEKLMRNIRKPSEGSPESQDGSDFYRSHFRDTLYRKRSDLQTTRFDHHAANSSADLTVFLVCLSAIGVLLIYGIGRVLNVDYAADLDNALERKVNELRKKKDDNM